VKPDEVEAAHRLVNALASVYNNPNRALAKTYIPPIATYMRTRIVTMIINGVSIEDTFAEAFGMTGTRVLVTAATEKWARIAAQEATGYASSVIGCDVEAGVERELSPAETPDGRPGVALLFFAFSRDALQKALIQRIGQCILTCATTACYSGLIGDPERSIKIGGNLRYFGDGWQGSKFLDGRRYWRVPVMDGEFLCEDLFGTQKGVAGGNLIILGASQFAALNAAELAVKAIGQLHGVLLPFPGGVVRSGSKVGSQYKKLKASTNDAYCPTLMAGVNTSLPEGVHAAYEIVIDGLSLADVEAAMRVGIRAACQPGVLRISAGNYGGNLGPYPIHLHRILQS
jgi:formylmethanofuran--tetrahydromethanopterin N-formyltransferase